MTALDTFTPEEEERHERLKHYTGFPECPDCHEEVQPGEGDTEGRCWYCTNGEERDG